MQAIVGARDMVCADGNVAMEVQAAALKVGQAVAEVRNTELKQFHSRLVASAMLDR